MSGIFPLLVSIGALIGVLALGFAYFRIGTSKVWQETAAGYKEKAELLAGQLAVAEARITALEIEVKALNARTDLAQVLRRLDDIDRALTSVAETATTVASALAAETKRTAADLAKS